MAKYQPMTLMMKSFLHRINYSSVNEDSSSEFQALRLQSNDRVLCVTGSGARPLDLLTQSPGEIVCMDFNPCQNYLLELKVAAMKHLAYLEYLDFLGIAPAKNRILMYRKICGSLSSNTRQYWNRNQILIQEGIFYQGNWENYFRLLALFLKTTRKPLLKRLFSCSTVQEQSALWDTEWNSRSWKTFLRTVSSRYSWKYLLQDPGFYLHVPDGFPIYGYLYERFNNSAQKFLFRKSPFATILFTGKLSQEAGLPPHLQEEHYSLLQTNLDRLTIKTASLGSIKNNNGSGNFTAFSLSDFSSYTTSQEYEIIWGAIKSVSSIGARICERQFLVKRDIPVRWKDNFIKNREMENQLSQLDNSIFYTFVSASAK